MTRHRHAVVAALAAVLAVASRASAQQPAEQFTAPAHIEAQHGSGCLAVHDELRCVLCQYAATRVTIQRSDAPLVATLHAESPYDGYPVAPTPAARHLTAPPRAPPFCS